MTRPRRGPLENISIGLFVLLLIGALIPLGFAAYARHQAEREARTVALVVDAREVDQLVLMGRADGLGAVTRTDVYQQLRAAGVTGVGLHEWTVADAVKAGHLFALSQSGLTAVGSPLGPLLPPDDAAVYVGWPESSATDNAESFPHFEDAGAQWSRAQSARLLDTAGERAADVPAYRVWRISAQRIDDFLEAPLGFYPEDVLTIVEAGLDVVPRLSAEESPFVLDPSQRLAALTAGHEPAADGTLPSINHLLFRGASVSTDPGRVQALVDHIDAYGLSVGLIEFSPQTGLDAVVSGLDYRAVRVHSITDREMASPQHMDETKAVARWLRAVRERGIRLLYVRFFLPQDVDGSGPFDTHFVPLPRNTAYVQALAEELEAAGYQRGLPEPLRIPPASSGALTAAVVLAGAMAGMLAGLLWRGFISRRASGVRMTGLFAIVGAIGSSALFWLLMSSGKAVLARQAAALVTAIAVPPLAVSAAVRWVGGRRDASGGKAGIFLVPAAGFIVATAITLIGALTTAVLLTETQFVLKLAEFRGVKLAHAAPLAIVVLLWWGRALEGFDEQVGADGDGRARIRRLLSVQVRGAHVAGAAVVLALIGVYLLRTGNEGLPVPAIEASFRRWLETGFLVRPRTKELLLGHPALFMALALLGTKGNRRPLLFLLILAGTVGQLSIINTFAHAHAPIAVSLTRTILGLILGGGAGAILAAAGFAIRARKASQRARLRPL